MRYGNIYINMNTFEDNDTNLDDDFEFAYDLCQKNHSHSELIQMLKKGNVAEKQIAALKLDYVADKNDVISLLNNLTGCDGKIREAVAFKINSLLSNKSVQELFAPISAKVFADASIDINANICRLIVDSALILKPYAEFSSDYTGYIIKFINESLGELDKFIFKDKKYVINKQLFKLYWCLEALTNFYEFVQQEELVNIIRECSKQTEYTIREKVAVILQTCNLSDDIKTKLMNDENYYVKQILHHPSVFQKV